MTQQRDNLPLDLLLDLEFYLQVRFSSLFALECPERSLSKLHHETFILKCRKYTAVELPETALARQSMLNIIIIIWHPSDGSLKQLVILQEGTRLNKLKTLNQVATGRKLPSFMIIFV